MTTNVLILCTHNSARSVLSECMLNHWAKKLGKDVRAYSAGSAPSGRINPYALEALGNAGIDISSVRSKSWDEFAVPGAPPLHFVFTVCDNAAGEVCPVWPGQPVTAHWGIPDPAAVEGTEMQKTEAFREAFRVLDRRVELFTSLPLASLEGLSLAQRLRDIGRA